ncbi:helix-turn-helix domain-containing protein [Streptacidiphilus neutrinimicus]|uniref:helix-turn-helix domain-containing protein n=1 Tax=Streptacidiphilus neutrinimicus TaxID=105420 RepID=UPI0005A8A3DA|nr:helix-turn-helix domain-containing protein [Streptacidiphilus neutrinimicus]
MSGTPQGSIAKRLQWLFENVHPSGRGPYTPTEVAQGIREAAGEQGTTLGASTIAALRSGARDNPSSETLRALAGFFGVKPSYFLDDEEAAEHTQAKVTAIAAMIDNQVLSVALRAKGLSPDSLRMVATVLNQARKLEGLPAPDDDGLDLNN